MTDRAILFLSSVVFFLGGIAVCVWLIATGQLGTFDGNFLLLSSILVTAAFGLYIRFLIRRAMEAGPPPRAEKRTEVRSESQTARPSGAAPEQKVVIR
ncbi:MAG TPA: hypothetical protein VL285_23915 [Bryobacteraceae bacterium]|jgi:hypothetical protein|nr:hypothetical protein [Bryobacteraceae bacterium]